MTAVLPLSGIKVVELGTVLAGPFAGSMLADLGAEVIKIETPGKGDVQRYSGHKKDGVTVWWAVASRDKKCITLNLKHPEGKGIFESLLRGADVLVENYRPGALEKLGFGWDAISKINSKLVVLSISGYGTSGPLVRKPGFGKILEGLSGVVTMTGKPSQRPLFVGFSLADASTGLFGVLGVAMALYDRDINGGRGHRVDIALYDPLFRMLECQLALHAKLGKPPMRRGSNDAYGWGLESKSRPRFYCVQASNDEWFLVRVKNPEALKPLFESSKEHNLKTQLSTWARSLDPTDLREKLQKVGVDIVPILDGMSISKNEYLRARGDVLEIEDPKAGTVSVPGWIFPPLQSGETRKTFSDLTLGQHNAEILERELGFTAEKIAQLQLEGVI